MRHALKLLAAATVALMLPAGAQAESIVTAPGGATNSGTYFDYMKTVYNRAGEPELAALPLTAFDGDYHLDDIGAKSFEQSADGLTWTITLRSGLEWSDGTPLTATDYVFALQRAAKEGYDFNWYWSFAGGIKNWDAVVKGKADTSTLGLKVVNPTTIAVTTETPKPYFPSVASLWYPVPKHVVDKIGDSYALNVKTLVSSGPFMLADWQKSTNKMTLVKNPNYHGPWQAKIDKLIIDPQLGDPAVGLPAFMAGDVDWTPLNAGQVPFAQQHFPKDMRKNAVFAVDYLSFDMTSKPFDNVDVRRALWYSVNRKQMTDTVLKNLAIPGNSLLAPGYPGYQQKIADEAKFEPKKAQEFLAKAGYPGGKGFPKVSLWYRVEGGYNGAIAAPMAQYLQAQYKKVLGIDIDLKGMPTQQWMNGLLKKENNFFLSPYEYDYLDPSNFYGLFYNGGRHDYHFPEYDKYVKEADSNPDWNARLKLYAKAAQVMIDKAMIVPLEHPITNAVVSDKLSGAGVEPNSKGFTPLDRTTLFLYTHLEKK